MTGGLPVLVCTRCGRVVFPERILCPDCGGSEWRRSRIEGGVVETATTLRRAPGGIQTPVPIGTVRLDGGPPVVARLAAAASPGDRVLLDDDEGVPATRPGERTSP